MKGWLPVGQRFGELVPANTGHTGQVCQRSSHAQAAIKRAAPKKAPEHGGDAAAVKPTDEPGLPFGEPEKGS